MSNLSSFLSSASTPTIGFSKHVLSNGAGTLNTFTNSTSGYLYGIMIKVNTSTSSLTSGAFTLNTALSTQSNTTNTIFVSQNIDGSSNYYRGFIPNFSIMGFPTQIKSAWVGGSGSASYITSMYIPLDIKFSGTTTISLSGTDVGTVLYAELYYKLD